MKIYKLPVQQEFQPSQQNFRMPTHGRDWGVEQDFLQWLQASGYQTLNQGQADWDYLPIFWNRLYINWNWGQDGLDKIHREIMRLVSRNRPTFMIAEYDVPAMQPFFDLCNMTVFVASRHNDDNGCIGIPLLCSAHKGTSTWPPPGRTQLASFVGNLKTYGLRSQMQEQLGDMEGVNIRQGNHGPAHFARLMLDSQTALAPRGYGGSSFRFYEAMQLGAVPYLIGDIDTRPFGPWIDWDACSLYSQTIDQVKATLTDKDTLSLLDVMGERAKLVWHEQLRYGKWCDYVIKELEQL